MWVLISRYVVSVTHHDDYEKLSIHTISVLYSEWG